MDSQSVGALTTQACGTGGQPGTAQRGQPGGVGQAPSADQSRWQ